MASSDRAYCIPSREGVQSSNGLCLGVTLHPGCVCVCMCVYVYHMSDDRISIFICKIEIDIHRDEMDMNTHIQFLHALSLKQCLTEIYSH